MEAHLSLFGDSVNLDERQVHGLRQMHYRLRNKDPIDPRHVRVPSDASKMISEPIMHLVQTVHLSFIKVNTISK